MSIVAIIGASDLGGALAHKLAARDRIDEVRLIDPAIGVAAGTALDIQQAGPIEGFRTRVVSASELHAARGAAVIALAGFANPTAVDEQGQRALALLKQLTQLDRDAVVVCAGASDRQVIELGVREIKIPRTRLIGSAPAALASALRALVALEVRGSPSDVSLAVLGIPPARTVILWSEANVRGQTLTQLLEPPTLARLKAQVPRLWPPGPFTLASAASRVCEAIAAGGSDRAYSCFVSLDGELGARRVVSAMTVLLGPHGVSQILVPSLSVHESVQLHNALAAR